MDNRDSCSLDEIKMDSNTVWQWRIMHVRKHSDCPEPLHHSSKLGLDFNVKANTKRKLDLQLVTNGVILEIYDFAEAVNKGEKYFITDILENNFSLGLENEQQRIDFTAQFLDLLRNPPEDEHEDFTLFDMSEYTSNSNNGLNKASTERKTDGVTVEMDDTNDGKHKDKFKFSQATSRENRKTESPSEEMDEVQKSKCSGEQSTKERREDVPSMFPLCEEIGLNLGIGAKQSLDPGLLTKGVMLELVHFTRKLTASSTQIVLDVLEHNFDLDLNDKKVKRSVWFQILNVLKKRKHLTRGRKDSKVSAEFKDEPFSLKISPVKRSRESAMSNVGVKRSRRGQSEHIDSDRVTDSGNSDHLDHLQNPTNPDIPGESEWSSLDVGASVFTSAGISFVRRIDERGVCGGKEKKQSPRNALHESERDKEQEEMGTENLWKFRANRVGQILPALNKEFSRFKWFKNFHLEFNIGFGSKQNISVDDLADCVLLKIAKFALAMNSSQQDFIMEILEHNFDLGLQNQDHRNSFACEIMSRIRQLRSCDDALKISNEVFKLPGLIPSLNIGDQSVGSVIPELSSVSKMDQGHSDGVCPPYSHADAKQHISAKSVDLYTSCKEIGLMLHVKTSQPNKKLDINKLTNAAVMEVTNFAEKLCGTFEHICLDIVRHNFDLDLQSEDSDLAKNILARIPAALEQKNLSRNVKAYNKRICSTQNIANIEKLYCKNIQNVSACSAGSFKASNMDQNGDSSTDVEYKNELSLKLWKLRANHIQQMLSVPHEEHCPLYSYSRCKKLGIDFDVGSGVKQNLDPKLLTNGVMVEFHTFATALLSARKDFVTEILEYNFDLDLKNEQYRSAFGHQTMQKLRLMNYHKRSSALRLNMVFEFTDVNYTQCPIYEKTSYCPKCSQDRNHRRHQDELDANHTHHRHPHAVTDTVSADTNCTAQKPETDPSEESIMDSYPLCKKIGLNLCVDKNQPRHKLDPRVLTLGVMNEVVSFAKKLCGTICKIIHTLIAHNFNIDKQNQDVNLVQMFRKAKALKDGGVAWFNEVFVIRPVSRRLPEHGSKLKEAYAMQRNEKKEIIIKRKLALQRKRERATLLRQNMRGVKSSYPMCTEIGLDLDVTSKSGEKKKLDLKLLTRAVVFEIHRFATQNVGHYYPRTVFDILDCNFDLSSQRYRRWEFSIATASKIKKTVKQYYEKDGADEVFKLPFLFDPQASERLIEKDQIECDIDPQGIEAENYYTCPLGESDLDSDEVTDSENTDYRDLVGNPKCSLNSDFPRELESSCLGICTPFLTSAVSSSLPSVNSNLNPPIGSQLDKRDLCQDEEKIQIPRNAPNEHCIDKEEIEADNYYTRPLGESDLDSDEVTDSENSDYRELMENPKRSLNSDFHRDLESSCLGDFVNSLSTSEVSSSPPGLNGNEDPTSASQLNEKVLCGGEEQTQTPRYAPDDCDLEQEEFGTENLWKLRANRVEQILSALNKEFGPFNRSKKVGIEFNVGFGPKKNLSVGSLANSVLLEIAKFALAINSSQPDFIMEILEYNFDLGLQSQKSRNAFTCDIMTRVRQLSSCEDEVKSSNEVFELPVSLPTTIMANQNESNVIPKVGNVSKVEECDVASHAETKEHKSVAPYPCCKEIGLKLHVNYSQPRKKLDFNKLTNGAMTEVTNFAETLCGTFDQICLDILRHNLSCDLQSGDSDLAGITFARIPAAIEQKNLATSVKSCKKLKGPRKDISTMEKLDSQNEPNSDAPGAGFSQTASTDKNVGSSAEIEHKNELDLKLWKLRANHIQRILSVPHEEHCPLYSYSRCKKLGIDFNVGSGVKQNLDPKLLTNGIMVEFNAFATALLSARKDFVTEILEYNFNLNLKNEQYRSAFGLQTLEKFKTVRINSALQKKMLFELPDLTCIQEPTHDKTTYCPKCYQERNHKRCHDEYDGTRMNHPHPNTMTDRVSADANCTAQKPKTDPSEETIMDSYPYCKKIGLNLCVDIDKPKDKLDRDNLTRGVMNEVVNFAKKLCGTKSKIIRTLLEHNFNIDKQSRDIDLAQMFRIETARKDRGLSWFSEVFVIRPVSHRQPGHENKPKVASSMQSSERKETIKKRKLALQMKEARTIMPSNHISVVKTRTSQRRKANRFPFCTKIGLVLDVKSKSGDKEKLDLELLTRAVVFEIHKFVTQKRGQSYPNTVFDILDYNFDLSSQHYRQREFSTATASKIQTFVNQCSLKLVKPYQVFKLPFVFHANASQGFVEKTQQNKFKIYCHEKFVRKRIEGRCVLQMRYQSDGNRISLVGVAKTNEESWSCDVDTTSLIDPYNAQMSDSLLSKRFFSPLHGNKQIKEEAYDPYNDEMTPEHDIDGKYQTHYQYVTAESNSWDVERIVRSEPAGSPGYSLTTTCPNIESQIETEPQNECVQYYMLAEPQTSDGHALLYAYTNSENNIKTELDTADHLDPNEAAASQEYTMVTIGEASESTVVKEEQENVLPDSYYDGFVSLRT